MPRDNNFLTRRNIYFPNACMVCVLSLMIAAYKYRGETTCLECQKRQI